MFLGETSHWVLEPKLVMLIHTIHVLVDVDRVRLALLNGFLSSPSVGSFYILWSTEHTQHVDNFFVLPCSSCKIATNLLLDFVVSTCHLPGFSKILRVTFPVSMDGTTGIKALLMEIFHEFYRSKVIVKVQMVVLVL